MQNLKDKPWRNEELVIKQKTTKTYKAKTGAGCDGFHSKVPLALTRETRGEVVEFVEKVEQYGRWSQQACTTMFFKITKNVTSERPIALMPTMIRWWEALRTPEVAKWQYTYRIEWDATDGRNGGALVEMERFNYQAGGRIKEAVAWQKPSSASVLQWCGMGDIFQFSQEDLAGLWCVQFEGCVAETLQAITAILPRLKWSCLPLRVVLQDALSEVTKNIRV